MTPDQIALARIALGIRVSPSRAYRNAFCAQCDTPAFTTWLTMVSTGYARKADTIAGRAFFWLTATGAALALRPGDTLDWETLPDEAVL